MPSIFRAMRCNEGMPQCGPTKQCLGVRIGVEPHADLPCDNEGMVMPGTGGMSVSPDEIGHLPRHRRPPAHGGTGRHPVWVMRTEMLTENIAYVPDPPHNGLVTHALIEPCVIMHGDAFQSALCSTAPVWERA
jgi:hypothetical protein